MAGDQRSKSGAPVWRHQGPGKPFEAAAGDGDAIEALVSHLERHLGPTARVFHEQVSHLVHVDLHLFAPGPERPFVTVVTTGMSERAMAVPAGAEGLRYAEVLLCLPPSWPLEVAAFADERNYWPLRLLKELARLPHENDTWLGWGHTVGNEEPPRPYAPGVGFAAALVEQPLLFPTSFRQAYLPGDKVVNFYSVVPLYPEELQLKLDQGLDALGERFDRGGVSELVEVGRPSVARR